MEINAITRPLTSSADTLHAFVVTKQNRDQLQALSDKNLKGQDIKVGADFFKKKAKNYHITSKQKVFFYGLGDTKELEKEDVREAIHSIVRKAVELKSVKVGIYFPGNDEFLSIIAETILLSGYKYEEFKSKKKESELKSVSILSESKSKSIEEGKIIGECTTMARDLVNEPVISLTAVALGEKTKKLGAKYGFKVDVFNKAKIYSLKMGGIMAVNYGSIHPPVFITAEYKPAKAKNKKPYVFIGKGVVFDTGGLSLKPTPNSMDSMKSDMAGGAAVIGAISAIARLKLPYHIIALVPATDNRPGENAITPGDVITMFDGTTVEILNTDAEGRLILGDALAYAKKCTPELAIDLATLTGAAVIAVGEPGIAMMSNAKENVKQKLKQSGENVYERLVELPLWKEYGEMIKSDVADIKNVGGRSAGAITAGKFLEHFVDYPWIHLDIAGPAFLNASDSYRGKHATGVGVRLLVDFIKNLN